MSEHYNAAKMVKMISNPSSTTIRLLLWLLLSSTTKCRVIDVDVILELVSNTYRDHQQHVHKKTLTCLLLLLRTRASIVYRQLLNHQNPRTVCCWLNAIGSQDMLHCTDYWSPWLIWKIFLTSVAMWVIFTHLSLLVCMYNPQAIRQVDHGVQNAPPSMGHPGLLQQ